MSWQEYHELTKHSVQSLRGTQHYLDWANMPNPFRHYEGVPVLDLPADPPAPLISALEVLRGKTGNTLARNGAEFLSQLMFYSASISASKRVSSTGAVYSLRVNPSSGNLHPTEFHFCSQGLVDWPDGLYHYRPSSHMVEQRAIGDFGAKLVGTAAPLIFVLTSSPGAKLGNTATGPIAIACTTSDMPGRPSRLLLDLSDAKPLPLAIS